MNYLALALDLAVIYLVRYLIRYCMNPYTLYMVVGSKGSGKSLYMARAANKWYEKRRGVANKKSRPK